MEFCHLVLDLVVALVCEHSYYVSTLLHVTLGGDYRGGRVKTSPGDVSNTAGVDHT